ncbi:DUF5615 family PIN-like protein [Massilia sp. R2A-15]|uniref:DUF5615 family PIN-like protein n=1 Tax=Massilia sp. R2A-15 TaxID=3064278 RepID=UPI0035A660E8
MKFLVDSQLPLALARHLTSQGIPCVHVNEVGLGSAADTEIWRYAKMNRMTIVSKDGDFAMLIHAKHSPPQLVWVRIGNCRSIDLISAFDRGWPSVEHSLVAGVPIVELR